MTYAETLSAGHEPRALADDESRTPRVSARRRCRPARATRPLRTKIGVPSCRPRRRSSRVSAVKSAAPLVTIAADDRPSVSASCTSGACRQRRRRASAPRAERAPERGHAVRSPAVTRRGSRSRRAQSAQRTPAAPRLGLTGVAGARVIRRELEPRLRAQDAGPGASDREPRRSGGEETRERWRCGGRDLVITW